MVLMVLCAAQRTAKLYGGKSETIAELIRRASQALELLACLGIEEPDLVGAVRESSEFDSDQTHGPAFPMFLEEPPQGRQEDRIEMSWLRQRMSASNGLKS